MKLLILLILILLILFNRSSFGVIYNVPIGSDLNIPLKDTGGVRLPFNIKETPKQKNTTININSYKDGIVSYSGANSGTSTNQFPGGLANGLYTSGNPVTNCITSYDASRRGMSLTNLVTNVCTTNGYYNYTSGTTSCTNSNSKVTGFTYTCKPSPQNPIQIISNGTYIIVIDGNYDIWWASTNLLTSPNWTKAAYGAYYICKGKGINDYFRINKSNAIIYHPTYYNSTGAINISNGRTFAYMCANTTYIIASDLESPNFIKYYANISTPSINTIWTPFPYTYITWGFAKCTITSSNFFIVANEDLGKLYVYKQFPNKTSTDYSLTNSSNSSQQIIYVNNKNSNFLVLFNNNIAYYGTLSGASSPFNPISGIQFKSICLNDINANDSSFYGVDIDGKIIYSDSCKTTITPVILS